MFVQEDLCNNNTQIHLIKSVNQTDILNLIEKVYFDALKEKDDDEDCLIEYCIACDNDAHWYIIEAKNRDRFDWLSQHDPECDEFAEIIIEELNRPISFVTFTDYRID